MGHMRPLVMVSMRPQGKSRVRSHEWRHVAEYAHFLSMPGWPVTPALLFADDMALSFYAGSQIHDRLAELMCRKVGSIVRKAALHQRFARELASASAPAPPVNGDASIFCRYRRSGHALRLRAPATPASLRGPRTFRIRVKAGKARPRTH